MAFRFLKRKKEAAKEEEKKEQLGYEIVPVAGQLDDDAKEKLKKARMFIVGCGTAGAACAVHLAAAGAWNIGLADNKFAEESKAKSIFRPAHVGKRKSIILADCLREIRPGINVVPSTSRMRYDNVSNAVRSYGMIIDCTNDAASHYLLSDACHILEKQLIIVSGGSVAVLDPKNGACYRCIESKMPFGHEGVPGVEAAGAAIDLALGKSKPGYMVENGSIRRVEKDEKCQCSSGITHLIDYEKWLGLKKPPESAASVLDKKSDFKHESAQSSGAPLEISPEEVKKKIESGEEIMLVDVRESWEYDIAKIEGSNLIPLGQLAEHMEKLPKSMPIVTYCHHGNRSMIAAEMMFSAGFRNVKSMKGGIDEWSKRIDSSVPVYD